MKYKLVNKEIKNNYIENLLKDYGIKNVENFLNPNNCSLQDWRDLDNIDLGIKLIAETINDSIPYAIVADSDCDGATSFAILYQYFKNNRFLYS